MELITNLSHTILSFIVILSVIVFIHEFGHYFIAKLCGVKIEVFSIGFGREIFGWNDRSGTRWKFSLLPFGGYVKMFGDAGAASTPDEEKIDRMTPEEKAMSFHYKPLWKKALIVAAGPIANFLLTIGIMTYFIYSTGVASTQPVIGEVIPDTAAAEAGLKSGDRILRVDGEEVNYFQDIPRKIITNLGTPVALDIQRGKDEITLTITPRPFEEDDGLGNKVTRPLIGFRSQKLTFDDVTLPQALVESTRQTYVLCETSLRYLGQIISGQRSATDLKGPIGIAKLSGQVTQTDKDDKWSDTVHRVLWFIAMLSANLGFVNLLPVPLLDGGHLMYYGIEAVRGRPMAERFQEYGFRVGFALLACLMAYTIFNDIRQLVL